MRHERNSDGIETHDWRTDLTRGLSRRHLIGAALSSFVMGANGLLLPTGVEDAAAHDHHPVRRLQDRADQRRHKQRTERARHRRRRRSSNTSGGNQQPAPQGCPVKQLDITLIFRSGPLHNQTMSVADGDEDRHEPYSYRWINHVVERNQQFAFVGWYPGMHLRLTSVSPNLVFEAYNPCTWFPTMKLTKDTPSGRTTLLDHGFAVNENVLIEGFSIKRLPDSDNHKVFQISYLHG